MKKSSLGRRNSNRPSSVAGRPSSDVSSVRKSGIPLPRQRAPSSERQSSSNAVGRLGGASSGSNLHLMHLMTPANKTPVSSRYQMASGMGTERPSRATSFGTSSVGTSSIGGQKSKRDNRPLQDKEWQAQAFRFIESIILEIPDGADMLGNGLKPLSITNFLDACNFLFRVLGHRVEITKHNWFKELPFLLNKKMQYKGKVEKSWMMAVSSAQGVPYALGVLHFLAQCVHILIHVDIDNLMFPAKFEEQPSDFNFQILIPYYNRSFDLRKSNKPDAEAVQEELDRAVLHEHYAYDEVHQRGPAVEENMNKVKNDYTKIAHERHLELQELMALEAECKNLAESIKVDEEKLVKSKIAENSCQSELEAIEQETAAITTDLSYWKGEHDKLLKKISQAPITLRDIENVKKKRDSIDRDIISSQKYIQSYQDMIYNEDLELVKLKTEIEQLTRESNLRAMKYVPADRLFEKMILPTKIDEKGSEFDHTNFDENDIQRLTASYESESAKLNLEISAVELEREKACDELEDAKAALHATRSKFALREAEVDSLLEERNKERKSMEDEIARATYEVETLEKRLKELSAERDNILTLRAEKEKDLEEAMKIAKAGMEEISCKAEETIKEVALWKKKERRQSRK